MSELKTYIGDGIYADFDGYALILTTEDGITETNRIYVEPREWKTLQAYVRFLNGGTGGDLRPPVA
jgi:hypothetical protein